MFRFAFFFFFFNDTATTEIYTLSLHDALPIWRWRSSARPITPASTIISAASALPRRSACPRMPRISAADHAAAVRVEQLKTLGGERDLEWFGWFFDQDS